MNIIRGFEDLSKNDAAIAGGKGASLGELTQAKIPVPPGFVILSGAFDRFLREMELEADIDTLLHEAKHDQVSSIEHASEQIRALILGAQMPQDIREEVLKDFHSLNTQYVAVRSSATSEDSADAAWAGQLESFLNTTESNLLENVKKCWASLFTPRAIFYRKEKQIHQKISVAVVIQSMVNSEVSGVAFSVNPISQDRNQIIIEASYGLGEAIVSGQVTPDNYVIEKQPRRILETNIHTKNRGLYRSEHGRNEWQNTELTRTKSAALSPEQILELSNLIIRIENHYDFPCDIEWALENKQFFIVQSRPITTLSSTDKPSIKLSKIYSREKPLLYFQMWNDSDRLGWRNFLDYEVKNNLFLLPGEHQKGSVWYEQKELDEINQLLTHKLQTDSGLSQKLLSHLEDNWSKLEPYLIKEKKLTTADEFKRYYQDLVQWWSAMNTAFGIPDMNGVDENLKQAVLSFREKSEKFTEKMSEVMKDFWITHHPEMKELVTVISPKEVQLLSEQPSPETIAKVRSRINGFALFNETVIPLNELQSALQAKKIALEIDEVDSTTSNEETLHGNTAFAGNAQGRVRIISSFMDMETFQDGEILVTEMTNPNYLPIMKRASAIITDEGGITCHAAIAARELKKPCIVGTKRATRKLQNGDEVLVNADTGAIFLMKKADIGLYQDYQTLFQVGGMPYLISDIFSEHYRTLQCLLLFQSNLWTSFLPRSVVQQTLADGESLYGDLERFSTYRKAFDAYKTATDEFFKKALTIEVTSEGLTDFLHHAAQLFAYYSKTEFFYTDQAFLASEKNPFLKESLKHLEEIKNSGREYLNKIFFGSEGYLNQYLEKVGENFGLSLEQLIQYSRSELLSLFDGQRLSDEEISHRKYSYIIHAQGDTVHTFTGKTAFDLIEGFLTQSSKNKGELKGICANNGKAKGKVKVIFSGYDNFDTLKHAIEAMDKGDILVAETTSPELIVACHKASAIITNQGGLMSHAAIVSREMSIPCVVGTGNATKILRDGDLVEVDGDNGRVHILSN